MKRKGEITSRQVDRDFPHQIEMRIPDGGFGAALHGLQALCSGLGGRSRLVGRLRRIELGDDAVRWCFKAPEDAATFRARFGGENLPPLTRARRRVKRMP